MLISVYSSLQFLVYSRSSISFLISSRFVVAIHSLWMCLRTILKLLSCFSLYVWNSVFFSLTMFIYAMELFGWILICSFLIFISYLSVAISYSFCDNDGKLLTTKMGRGLVVFSTLILLFSLSSFSPSLSKELVVGMSLLN